MEQFKVFYSWQSDLPGNKNKNFINRCIEEAVEKCNDVVDGVEIIADRDTKGLTGSPNISQAIFSKIDECDLFIADVSIVNSFMVTESEITEDGFIDINGGSTSGKPEDVTDEALKIRNTPNPNVLIELGYAVKCLGWERVICFINTEYGRIEQLPFDLEHQRVTPYTIDAVNKEATKKYLRAIICDTILELAKQGSRPKQGYAYHIIGTYDPDMRKIEADIKPYNIRSLAWINGWFYDRKVKAEKLIEEINLFKIPMPMKQEELDAPYLEKKNSSLSQVDAYRKFIKTLSWRSGDDRMRPYCIGKSDRDSITELGMLCLQKDSATFDDKFFNLGNMKTEWFKPVTPWDEEEFEKEGTEEEIEKEKKIRELQSILVEMNQFELYIKTFDEVLLFPLAIENTSKIADEEISIVVTVTDSDGKKVPLIMPTVDFINPEIRKVADIIYKSKYPQELLVMPEDEDIEYDDTEYLYYDPEEPFYGNPVKLANFPVKIGEKEYEYAMEYYVAQPIDDSYYKFSIDSLRAGEKKWIRGMIAIYQEKDVALKVQYRIKSKLTDGSVGGMLHYS